MQGPYLRKYGVETTVDFVLFGTTGVDLKTDAAHASGDTTIMKDEAAEANTTNAFTDEGQGYSIVLTATEMQAARVVVYVVDQGTKAWLDTVIVIETYGHASAMHKVDLSDSVRMGLTALPNAAADAAGGLPISDAGGLDLDAKLANTNEITAARMGALTDLIDGGRLDLIIDDILGDIATVYALLNPEIADIKAKTDLIPASPAAVSDVPTTTEIVTAIKAGIADGSYDFEEMIRIIFAVCACKSSGGGTSSIAIRDSADSKNRVAATVDANGNRTAVTLNGA